MGSSSTLVRRALSSTGAMTLLHRLRCSWMISPILPNRRSASTYRGRRGVAVGHIPMHPPCWGTPAMHHTAVPPDPTAQPQIRSALTSHSSPDS